MKSNRALDEIQVTVIYSRAILVARQSAVESVFCKTWTVTFETLANNADPDQTPQKVASDQGLHCLLKLQEVKG